MADTKIDASGIAYLLNRRLKGVTDQIAKACPLFKWLKEKGCVNMGSGWNDGFEFYIHTGNSYKDGVRILSDWSNVASDVFNDMKKVSVPGCIIAKGLAKSAFQDERLGNMPDRDVNFDQLLERLNQVKQACIEVLCSIFYGDGTSRDARDVGLPTPGLEAMVGQTNTYATIDRSVAANAFFKAQYQTIAASTFQTKGSYAADTYDGVYLMRKIIQSIELQGAVNGQNTPAGLPLTGEEFDAAFTDLATYLLYESTFDAGKRYESTDFMDQQVKKLPIAGKPLMTDAFCTANRIYFAQAKAINVECVKKGEFFQVIAEDKTNIVQSQVLNTQIAMWTKKPRALGVLKLT